MNLFRKAALGLALAFGALLSGTASATVICNACDYITTPAGTVATYIGEHNPLTDDNSTVSNASTGQIGNFSNWWVFKIDPAGLAALNAIFLPTGNVSNFDVRLYDVTSQTCGAHAGPGSSVGAACSALTTGALVADGTTNPNFVTNISFLFLDAGYYAFNITGTVLSAQSSSYVGQVKVTAIPEPGSLALVALSLVIGGVSLRNRRRG